jgi:hypothetical protein
MDRRVLRRIGLGLCAVLLAALAPVSRSYAEQVDLELVLAIDVSGSIDEVEADLQRRGYLKALVDPAVVGAITSGRHHAIAVTYVEWAGGHFQRTVVDWSVIRDLASAKAFAAKLDAEPVITAAWTSISGAIQFGVARFAESPHKGDRRVIDISGDGRNNSGLELEPVRRMALAKGITINGLPIMNNRPNPYGRPPDRDLDKYYRNEVIGGRGAFIVVAQGFGAFAEAIRAKLIREVAGLSGPVVQVARAPNR